MKTTIELPDIFCRQAEAEAAPRGREFKDLVEEGLRRVLATPSVPARRPDLAELMKSALGAVESGVPDLGSDPAHLKDFGRDAGHR